jgi:hypothetical protein
MAKVKLTVQTVVELVKNNAVIVMVTKEKNVVTVVVEDK